MDLGKTIKQCRKLRGFIQIELAGASGLSVAHLSLIEQNKREPSINAIGSIANALGIPLSVLIFLAAEDTEISELNAQHVKKLANSIRELIKDVKK